MASAKRLLGLAKLLLGWPLALLAITFLLKLLFDNAGSVLPRVNEVNVLILLSSMIFFFIYYFLRAAGWGLLMEMMGHKVKLRNNVYAWQFSEIKRYIPGNIWSFLSRATMFEALGIPKKDSGKAILYEIEFLIVSNMLISFLAIDVVGEYLNAGQLVLIIWAILTIIALALILFGHKFGKQAQNLFPPFGVARNIMTLSFYLITFSFLGIGTYLATASVLGPYNYIVLIGFFSFSFLIGYLSLITPSGLGVREGAITYGLAYFLTIPVAGFVAIFSRIVLVLSELIFTALIFLWHKTRK